VVLKEGRQVGAYGTFAICPGDVYGRVILTWEVGEEASDALETGIDHVMKLSWTEK